MPLHMRLPKLKGFTNPFRTEYQVSTSATSPVCSPKVDRSRSRTSLPRVPFARTSSSRFSATAT